MLAMLVKVEYEVNASIMNPPSRTCTTADATGYFCFHLFCSFRSSSSSYS